MGGEFTLWKLARTTNLRPCPSGGAGFPTFPSIPTGTQRSHRVRNQSSVGDGLHSVIVVKWDGGLGSGIREQAAGRRGSWKNESQLRVLDAIHSFIHSFIPQTFCSHPQSIRDGDARARPHLPGIPVVGWVATLTPLRRIAGSAKAQGSGSAGGVGRVKARGCGVVGGV